MSDCSQNAMSAPKPLEGQINWNAGHMPTPLNYARYVDGVERVAESIELDDVLFVPVVRCKDCKAMRIKYGNVGIECWKNGEPFTVEPDSYCAWGEWKEGGDD